MNLLFARAKRKAGMAPGTIEYIGEQKVSRVTYEVFDYSADHLDEKHPTSVEDVLPYRDTPHISWINIEGLHDTAALARLGEHFGIHPLVMEDIVNVHQRPKMEDYKDYLYIVAKMVYFDETRNLTLVEQVSLVLGARYVISFQEGGGDVFGPIRERLRGGQGRSRTLGPDYLAYALLDAIVDHYFLILERVGERVEKLEDELLREASREVRVALHELKRDLLILRRSIWPMRDVLANLSRFETSLIQSGTHVFLRDVYDHSIRVVDYFETYRDMLMSLQELYLASISNRLNEVMKVLTIIATVFIPLSFFAGIYGMNFEYFPELRWRWGYPLFWLAVLLIGGGMLYAFRRKRWL